MSVQPLSSTPERILQRLEWLVIRRLDGLLQGDYRTLFYGAGIDFSDLREYQPQDDIRHIDWNVTARTNSLHVRQYLEDREITAWFLLDVSPSMQFGSSGRPKQLLLIDFVGTMARLLTRGGNQVGAFIYDLQQLQTIPPLGGRKQVLRLIRDLLVDGPARPIQGTTDLRVMLNGALSTLKRRSLVFFVSDFISEPGWMKPLAALSRRHEIIPLRIWDRREVELPDAGLIYFEDAETGEQLMVDSSDPLLRRRFVIEGERRESALKQDLRQIGLDLFSISAQDDLVGEIVRLAATRKMRWR